MKKIAKVGMLAFALSFSPALSQVTGVGITAALTAQMPVSDFADAVGLGVGGLAGFEVGMYPGMAFTARGGYLYHFEENNLNFSQIPILAGVKFIMPMPVYVAGELGPVFTVADVPGGSSTNESNFGWSVGGGGMAGPADIRLMLNILDAANMDDSMTIGLSVGFNLMNMNRAGRNGVD